MQTGDFGGQGDQRLFKKSNDYYRLFKILHAPKKINFGIAFFGVLDPLSPPRLQVSGIKHCRIVCPYLTLLGKLSRE